MSFWLLGYVVGLAFVTIIGYFAIDWFIEKMIRRQFFKDNPYDVEADYYHYRQSLKLK